MRLIDVDVLITELNNLEPRCSNKFVQQGIDDGLHFYMPKILEQQPTIDVVPVVHGRWEYHDCVCSADGLISVYACSVCQCCIDEEVFDQLHAQNFCPNCGSKLIFKGDSDD